MSSQAKPRDPFLTTLNQNEVKPQSVGFKIDSRLRENDSCKKPMPKGQSKKTTHKKIAHTKKTSIPTSVQRDITEAVNSLPSLLIDQNTINSIQSKQTEDTQPPRPSMIPPSHTYQPPQHSGVLLVVGVALLMVTILGLWAWNMKSMVNSVFAAPSAEKQILSNVGDDFSDIINYIEEQDTLSAKLDELQAQTVALSAASTISTTTPTDLKAAFSNILNATTTTSTP